MNREVIFANKNAGKKTFEQIEEYLRENDFRFGDIVYGFSEENLQTLKNKLFTKKNLYISQQDPLDFILKKIIKIYLGVCQIQTYLGVMI